MVIGSSFFAVKRILLAEDSDSSAMIVKSVFSTAETGKGRAKIKHVSTLRDVFETLSKAEPGYYDVVLLDLTLPDSSGFETVEKFRNAFPDIAVVILTGANDESLGVRAISLGAQDFLFKDETYPKLLIRQTNYAYHRMFLEQQLKDSKTQAEQATLLKDQFVSLVSHDLKGPLSSIYGLLKIALEAKELGEEEREKCVFNALKSTEGLIHLVESLLDISRLQQGIVKPKLSYVNAHCLIDEVRARLDFLARKKQLAIKNDVDKTKKLNVDHELFAQVFQNLIGNAIKFSHPETTISIYYKPGDPAYMVVEDTGVGIAEDQFDKLFLFSEKATMVGTAGERGTGLGLPHCKEILTAHGGDLFVESELGQGSRFIVELPEHMQVEEEMLV